MFRWIAELPDQLAASGDAPGLDAVQPLATPPSQVLICGMGGSAMAGSLLADGWPQLAAPVIVHREPDLPGWAGPGTLVIACSYSGQTQETLAVLTKARARGCGLAAVTSGGDMLRMARGEDGGRAFPAVQMPGGQPPRTALGHSLGCQLHLMHALGLLRDPRPEIDATCDQLANDALVLPATGDEPAGRELARELAADLVDRFTVIHTSGQDAHGAGRRLLAQLNENAKAPGHVAAYPELNHNEIVGWDLSRERAAGFAVVTLRGAEADAGTAASVDVALELLADQFAVVRQVRAHGSGRLARAMGLIVFADLVSAHLAVLRGVDPVPITRIDTLKSRLASR
jgi:glucose/mannose-6-phosphate isomerase